MSTINFSSREINFKIVYYGPALSGKTTNLMHIYGKLANERKGELISLATHEDRTLFFDFFPLELGEIQGFKTRFHMYTVPGQVYYEASRKIVLSGADGVVFVADSNPAKRTENIESLQGMLGNMEYYGLSSEKIPITLQYNKRDLHDLIPVDDLDSDLRRNGWPRFQAVAISGEGVLDTIRVTMKAVLRQFG